MELRRYWQIFCRRKWLFISTVILLPLFVFVLLKLITPLYESEAQLMFKANTYQQLFLKDVSNTFGTFNFISADNAMGSIEQLLQSNAVAGRVIKEMNLRDKNGDLLSLEDFVNPSLIKRVRKKAGVAIDYTNDTETFKITGYSTDPAKAKEISDRVVEYFFNYFIQVHKSEAEAARKVIETRLPEVRRQMQEAEQAVKDYKAQFYAFDVVKQGEILADEISKLESSRQETVRAVRENQLGLETIRNSAISTPQMFKDTPSVDIESGNPVIEDYKKQLLELEKSMAKASIELTPEHPDVKMLQKQIAAVREAIKREMSKSLSSQIVGNSALYSDLATRYSAAVLDEVKLKARASLLNEQITDKKRQLSELPDKELRVKELSREADNLSTTYSSLLSNLEAVKSALVMDLRNTYVYQPAWLSEKLDKAISFPPKKLTMPIIVSVILATLLGAFLAFLADYIDDSLWSPRDIEGTLGQVVLGTVQKTRKRIMATGGAQGALPEGDVYNVLTAARLSKGGEIGKIISLTSPMRKEGKSQIAVSMASALAQKGNRIVLIDGNLRHPLLHAILNLPNTTGLSNYLAGDAADKDLITSSSVKNLDVITSGSQMLASPQAYLDSERLPSLLKALADRYDFVLVDTPALVNGSDALILSKHAQDIFCVIAQGETSRNDANRFMNTMKMSNLSSRGIILNKVREL